MVIDCEMNQPSGSLVEVGGVVGDLSSGEVLERFQFFVHCPESICDFLVNTSKLTQADLDNGLPLIQVYEALVAIHAKWGCFRNPVVWGSGERNDALVIKDQITKDSPDFFTDDESFVFGHRVLDTKTVYHAYAAINGTKTIGGLGSVMKYLGLVFEGKKHRALDDAFNTWRMWSALLSVMKDPLSRPGRGRAPLTPLELKAQRKLAKTKEGA